MRRDTIARQFSRDKHSAGGWQTSQLAGNFIRRFVTTQLSFKHQGIQALCRKCSPEFTVVDLGCGNGAYSHFFLSDTPATVLAVDWSPEALANISPPKNGTLFRICADVQQLPIKNSCIDALFSIDMFGHLTDRNQALDEIIRICRGGAPLFLHSECADYRVRWPDHAMIRKTGRDFIAEIDGHIGIIPSTQFKQNISDRFICDRFFSPAGLLGWCIGYPDKYHEAFNKAGFFFLSKITDCIARLYRYPFLRYALRTINLISNHLELMLNISGGGSCFTCARTYPTQRATPSQTHSAIDIIIPTFNRESQLQPLVTALLDQCTPDDRIIIIWQGTKKPRLDNNEKITLVHLRKPNLPAARNRGLQLSNNPIVLFLDDDISVHPDLLDAHRGFHSEHANCAVAGNIDDPLFPETGTPSRFDVTTGELIQAFNQSTSSHSLSVMGANMSFSREALQTAGNFDTSFKSNALWEEIDLSFRFHHAGFPIYYCSDAKVTHHRQPDGGCRSDQQIRYLFHLFANTAYFACTYAPIRHLPKWLTFWKYRLEYLTRKNDTSEKHSLPLLLAGIAGVTDGVIRFITKGKRRGLPEAVTDPERNKSVSV